MCSGLISFSSSLSYFYLLFCITHNLILLLLPYVSVLNNFSFISPIIPTLLLFICPLLCVCLSLSLSLSLSVKITFTSFLHQILQVLFFLLPLSYFTSPKPFNRSSNELSRRSSCSSSSSSSTWLRRSRIDKARESPPPDTLKRKMEPKKRLCNSKRKTPSSSSHRRAWSHAIFLR